MQVHYHNIYTIVENNDYDIFEKRETSIEKFDSSMIFVNNVSLISLYA